MEGVFQPLLADLASPRGRRIRAREAAMRMRPTVWTRKRIEMKEKLSLSPREEAGKEEGLRLTSMSTKISFATAIGLLLTGRSFWRIASFFALC